MIYFISVIDVSEGGGVPKWDFIHPDTPHPLRERLEKYRELAASFVYGIITAFGGEIVGDRVRELRLSEIQAIFMRLKHKGAMYYVVFIVDVRDNPKAVYRIFMSFYRRYYKEFDEVLTSMAVPTVLIERLRAAMAQFLVPYARKSVALGARDRTHLLTSYAISLIISGVLAFTVWIINRLENIMKTNPLLFVGIVFLCLFFLPAIPIGWLTQYRKLAMVVSYLNSITIVTSAAVLWQEMLNSSAASILGRQPGSVVVISAATLIGVMLGTVMAFLSLIIAGFFERRKLTCIRPLKLVPEEKITVKKEEIGAVPEAPTFEELSAGEGAEVGPTEEKAEGPSREIPSIEEISISEEDIGELGTMDEEQGDSSTSME